MHMSRKSCERRREGRGEEKRIREEERKRKEEGGGGIKEEKTRRRGEEEDKRRKQEEEKRRGRREEERKKRRKKRRGEEEEKKIGKRRRKRRRRRRREREPTPFTLFASSHLVRGVLGPRKRRCRPSRGHPRHHWHCLGDLTPVLASYSDITGLFCSSRLRRTFLAPRLGLQSGTTSCRRARQRTQMNTAALTPPFRRFKKEGKGTTDGNRPT